MFGRELQRCDNSGFYSSRYTSMQTQQFSPDITIDANSNEPPSWECSYQHETAASRSHVYTFLCDNQSWLRLSLYSEAGISYIPRDFSVSVYTFENAL